MAFLCKNHLSFHSKRYNWHKKLEENTRKSLKKGNILYMHFIFKTFCTYIYNL